MMTYRASVATTVVLVVLDPAGSRDVARDLDVVVQRSRAGGQVLEERDVRDSENVRASSYVGRGPVSGRRRILVALPRARVLGSDAEVVEVELRARVFALPHVSLLGVHVDQRARGAGLHRQGDVGALVARVRRLADGDGSRELALHRDAAQARSAERVVVGVGQVQLATLADQAAHRLARSTLRLLGPLRRPVAGRAGIVAEVVLAAVARRRRDDVGEGDTRDVSGRADVLQARPAPQLQPRDGDGAVVRGELAAGDLAVGEGRVEAGTGRGGGGHGRLGRGGSGGLRRRLLHLVELAGRRRRRGVRVGRGRREGRGTRADDDALLVRQAVLGVGVVHRLAVLVYVGRRHGGGHVGRVDVPLLDGATPVLVSLGVVEVRVLVVVMARGAGAGGERGRDGEVGSLHRGC